MTRAARLMSAILALSITVVTFISLPAAGEPGTSTLQPSLTLKDAPVQEVLRLIAKAQGVDILMTDDVQGNISLEVSGKTPEEILDLVASAKNLHWWKERDVYVVSGQPRSATPQQQGAEEAPLPKARHDDKAREVIILQHHKAQDLAYLFGGASEPYTDLIRAMQKAAFPYGAPGEQVGVPLGATKAVKPPRAETASAVSRNPFEELSQVTLPGVLQPGELTPGVTPGGQAGAQAGRQSGPLAHLLPEGLTNPPVAFAPLNALIVQGTPEAIEEFRKLVEMLDVRVPQIMVEAQFVEMRVDDARQFGIDWSWIGGETSVDVAGIAAGGNVGVSFVKGRFSALLQTMLNNDHARIINAPRLATMNNQPVTFTISRTFFYFTTDTIVQPPGFAGSQVITTNTLNALPVVTTFSVLPQVNGDNTITVDVSTVISDVAGFITGPNGERIPEPTATALPTRLRVGNGETIVMGGFIRKNVSTSKRKVPFLSDIPIIGKALFTGTTFTESDSELLIFLTARVIEEEGAPSLEESRVPFMTIPLSK